MTLDDALLRFCEHSTVTDYVDSKNRQNVSLFPVNTKPIFLSNGKFFLDSYTENNVNRAITTYSDYSFEMFSLR